MGLIKSLVSIMAADERILNTLNTLIVFRFLSLFFYRLYVIANYTLVHGQQPCEIQTTSSVIYYTTVGPPRPPKLRVMSVDMHQV